MAGNHDDEIIHRQLDTDRDDPAVTVAEAVADIEDRAVNELPTTFDCIDDMLTEMYSTPPSSGAQLEVEFTYAGYRITVEQSGAAKFVQVS